MILAALLLAGAPASESTFENDGLFRVKPAYWSAIVDEFDAICLSSFPEGEKFLRAVSASEWQFSDQSDVRFPWQSRWKSVHGRIDFNGLGKPLRGDGMLQCNLDTAARDALDVEAVASLIEAKLVARFGDVPEPRTRRGHLVWNWHHSSGYEAQLMLIREVSNPSVIHLSVQYLKANK